MRFLVPIVAVTFDHNFLIRLRADKSKRPRPDRMGGHFIAAAIGNDADRTVGKVPQQSGKRLFQMKYDRYIVWRVDVIHKVVSRRFGAANLALQQRIKSPLHIAGSQRPPVVKLHTRTQMKNIGTRIGYVPAHCQLRLYVQVLIARQQIIKQQTVDALRLRIQPNSRIQIRRAALDNHDQRVRIRLRGAANQKSNTSSQ